MTKAIKEALLKKRDKKDQKIASSDYLSTGSTLLNIACSGKAKGGFVKGLYHFIVGDTNSGKSFLSMTCLAEAAINKHFDDYRFIYDNVEDGVQMDIAKFFGEAVAERLEPPAGTKDDPKYSETVEDFYDNLDDAGKDGRPFIYILDSMDAIGSRAENEKFQTNKKARKKGVKEKGDYGDGKAKINSRNLRRILPMLRKSKSILIIINQTRDNIDAGMFDAKKTRSGGHALGFYASIEIWSSVGSQIKKNVNDKDRQIGSNCRIKVKRSRLTGRSRTVEVPIYFSFGIDDIGSCVDYLTNIEKHWKKSGGKIHAEELDVVLGREKLIRYIEKNELEQDLRDTVQYVWDSIEDQLAISRKSKYQ